MVTPKVKEVVGESLPAFGPYLTRRRKVIAEHKRSITPAEAFPAEVHRPALRPSKPIPAVKVGTVVRVCVRVSVQAAFKVQGVCDYAVNCCRT